MIVKDKFELIYKTSSEIYNIVPLSINTLKAYEIDIDEKNHIRLLVNSTNKTKKHALYNTIDKELDSIVLIRMDTYPLPAFVTNSGIGVINLSVLPVKMITDYNPMDLYTLFIYVIALKNFVSIKPFKDGIEINVSGFIFSIFMKLFGKKSGLIGSYKYLIPKLQYLIHLYVSISMLDIPQNESTKKKISSMMYIDFKELNLDYDFGSTIQFLKSINDNDIIPMSENKFSTIIINMGGINSLPIFEDLSRFFSTLIACNIPNSQFSSVWTKINPRLYNKLVDVGIRTLNRIV